MEANEHGLSYIVPAYNEEKSIAETLRRLLNTLYTIKIPFEIIVVNDGSRDSTKELAEQFEGVRVINHPINIGYGNSLKSGIRNARFEWIGIVDADGSYPIEDIPVLLTEMEKGFDMVVGVRSNFEEIDSRTKRFFRRIFKILVNFLNDSRIEDPNSGMRIMRREMVLPLFPFLCGTFSFTTSLTILTSGLYSFISYVPIQYSNRVGHSKVRHFRDSLRTTQFIAQGIMFFNPIKCFLFLAFFNIIFVCIPAMTIAMFRMKTLSLYYMIFGTSVTLMVGMGFLGDIFRISVERKNGNFTGDNKDDN